MKFQHIGIPTTGRFDGEIPPPHLKITVSNDQNNPLGIQWRLQAAIEGCKVIFEPNSPSQGVMVALIQVNGAPVQLPQIDHDLRPDL